MWSTLLFFKHCSVFDLRGAKFCFFFNTTYVLARDRCLPTTAFGLIVKAELWFRNRAKVCVSIVGGGGCWKREGESHEDGREQIIYLSLRSGKLGRTCSLTNLSWIIHLTAKSVGTKLWCGLWCLVFFKGGASVWALKLLLAYSQRKKRRIQIRTWFVQSSILSQDIRVFKLGKWFFFSNYIKKI